MFKKFASAAAMALLSASAFAGMPTNFYGGVNLGVTHIDDFSGNKASAGAFVGYGFNPQIAVELGYRQHGTWDFMGFDVKVKQTDISAIASVPVSGNLDVFGRFGYSNAKVEVKGFGARGDDDTDKALFGAGLSYTFSPFLSGRVEVQRPASDTTNVGISAIWKF